MARDDSGYELWIARPDGSGLRSLDVGGEFGDSEPLITYGNGWAWSPDSKRIAFVHAFVNDGEDPLTINILNLATGGKRRLTIGTYPVWSPDGGRIAFVDRCRIWLIPAKGGKRKPITPRPTGNKCISDLRWSPDGRWIAATASSGNGVDGDPLVARSDGKRQYEARLIRPAAVRWPRDCTRLFFYPVPHLDLDVVPGGWIVHGPRGLPRFAPLPAGTYEESQVDWHC